MGTDKSKISQSMASTPEQMIKLLADVAFMQPAELQARGKALHETHFIPFDAEILPQYIPEAEDTRNDINSAEIESFTMKLVDIAKESKAEGDILWGRIQGTKHEKKAQTLVEDSLKAYGIEDVRRDHFPIRNAQWTPTVNSLSITSSVALGEDVAYPFADAITPFPSGQTPAEGITAEVIYVGQGTSAELTGRDLTGKIVLLQADFSGGGPMYSSARTAYSRIATGMYGAPAGVIAWWTLPGAKQIATRIGAMGGGDSVGEALPWVSLGYEDGLYLRKIIDRATPAQPVIMNMAVQGHMEDGSVRESSNVYGFIPGNTGKTILMTFHVDSYFYGLHDNAGTAAMAMAVARHYAERPLAERGHGLCVLSVGDHEHPGVGATDKWIEQNHKFVRDEMLMIIRPEKLGLMAQTKEGPIQGKCNQAIPAMLLVTNKNKLLLDVYTKAIQAYGLPSADFYYQDPAADETHFHPPFAKFDDLDAISTGFAISSYTYHSTADHDLGLVSFKLLEKNARAHMYVIDLLAQHSKSDLQQDSASLPDKSIYSSELFKLYYGNC